MKVMTSAVENRSVLVIGATGRTGLESLRKLAMHPSNRISVHAFCRNANKFEKQDRALCTSLVEGDARSTSDLEKALRSTKATTVVVAVGNGDSVTKSDIRTASAHALVEALQKPEFQQVQTVVVSSNGAGGSKIIVGMGIGSLISYHLRHVMDDHTGQEAEFVPIMDRTTIIRPTSLVDNEPDTKLVDFADDRKGPSLKTDRSVLGSWIAEEVVRGVDGHTVINLTGVKKD